MKTAVKVVLALLFGVGFLALFIWFSERKPAFVIEKIELCSATHEFTSVRPDELPEADTKTENLDTFCKFSYAQGFKAVMLDRGEVTVSLVGITSNGMKVGTEVNQYGPIFYSPMSSVSKPIAVEVYYDKQIDSLTLLAFIGMVIAGAIGWGMGSLFVRL